MSPWAPEPSSVRSSCSADMAAASACPKRCASAREVCAADVEPDGMVFDPATVKTERIKEDADYEGVRVRFVGLLGRARRHADRRRVRRRRHASVVSASDSVPTGAPAVTAAGAAMVAAAGAEVAAAGLSAVGFDALDAAHPATTTTLMLTLTRFPSIAPR